MEHVYGSVRSSSKTDGLTGVKEESLFWPAASFTLLENMKIWCKILVIIYPLILKLLNFGLFYDYKDIALRLISFRKRHIL